MRSLNKMVWEKGLKIVGALTLGALTLRAIRLVVVWSELLLMDPQVRKYKGDWALITGGSEGIGKAIAGALAQQGINVVLVSRTQQKLNAAAKEIKTKCPAVEVHRIMASARGLVRTFSVDLSHLTGVQQLLRCLTHSSIPITVFVANLGLNTGRPRPYIEYSATEEAYIQATNGQACYSLVRGLLPGMLLRGRGAVVAISSTAHRFGTYLAAYGAEKAKLNSLMSSLSQELHGTGITAQSMVIGPVLTRAVAELWAPAPAAAGSAPPNTSTATTEDAATAALARCKPTALTPAADTVGQAIVRAIERVGPVVTPYWGHAVADWLLLDVLWPPSLQRAACRAMARHLRRTWAAKVQDSRDAVPQQWTAQGPAAVPESPQLLSPPPATPSGGLPAPSSTASEVSEPPGCEGCARAVSVGAEMVRAV